MNKTIRIKLFKSLALTLAMVSVIAVAPNKMLVKANAEEQGTWREVGSYWYYLDNSGKVETGWMYDNGYWYYLNSSGVMQTGWVYDSGNWFYLYSNGQMAKNTTIDGYYLGSNGAWTTAAATSTNVSSSTALSWRDIKGTHTLRGDIAPSADDVSFGDSLSSYNIDLNNSDDATNLKTLCMNLAQGKLFISEAQNQVVGKIIFGKYRITNIQFFDESFKTTQTRTVDTIKSSSLYNYKSSATYTYDKYLIFSCGNARSNEWEAMRVVIESEEI